MLTFDNSTDFWDVEAQDFLNLLDDMDACWTAKIMSKEDMQQYTMMSLQIYIKAAGYNFTGKAEMVLEQFADHEEMVVLDAKM